MPRGKIGIFDSGVGGLTVADQIQQDLPGLSFLYFGDTKYVPYGTRSAAEVIKLIERICRFLVGEGAEALVMACNTSSALAYEHVSRWSPVPVVGIIEAAAKAASRLSAGGRIGVISNVLTASSRAYERAVHRYRPEAEVHLMGCPKLVPLAERGAVSGPEAEAALHEYVDPLLAHHIDTLVLGCTHYPFFRATLQAMLGPQVLLVDPAAYVAGELTELGLIPVRGSSEREYAVSGDPQSFAQVARELLGYELGQVRQALNE